MPKLKFLIYLIPSFSAKLLRLWISYLTFLLPDGVTVLELKREWIYIYIFELSVAVSSSGALQWGTSGSAVWISVCLTPLTRRIFSDWLTIPSPIQNTMGIYTQFTILRFNQVSSRLGALRKLYNALSQVSNIFVLSFCATVIDFTPQILQILACEVSGCLLVSRWTWFSPFALIFTRYVSCWLLTFFFRSTLWTFCIKPRLVVLQFVIF